MKSGDLTHDPSTNNPPVDPLDGFTTHIEDLLTEARNWLDGEALTNQGQADAVARLLDMLRTAFKDTDAARVKEKKPHDEAAKAVQERWKPLLDKCELAANSCKKTLGPWLEKLERERQAAALKAHQEAEQLAQQAAEAAADRSGSLESLENAETLIVAAKNAQKTANKIANERPQAKGEAKAVSLRTYRTPVLVSAKEALAHYIQRRPDDIKACLLELARLDIAEGRYTIPGVRVDEEKRAQ